MIRHALQAALVVLLLSTSAVAIYALNQVSQLHAAVATINQQIAPKPNYTMWSVGTGGDGVNPYIEWLGLYPESTLYPIAGAPSLRFKDQSAPNPSQPRDFEIGFYKYGPTWYTRNFITEFWIGSGNGGIFSVAGNDQGGGKIQVRNPADTDSIQLDYTRGHQPTINTESGVSLHFAAKDGLISDNQQTFSQGIAIPASSGYAGQVIGGQWLQGAITVASSAVAGDSLVLITPLSQPKGSWWVSHLDTGKSFTVFSSAADERMDFNWLIVSSGAQN